MLTTSIRSGTGRESTNEFVYERRLGARNQFEVVVPLLMQEGERRRLAARPRRRGGRGQARAVPQPRRAAASSARRAKLMLPTGKESAGLAAASTIFEPFVAFGQMLPADGFLQAQAGLGAAASTRDRAEREAFWRGAVGKTFTQGQLRPRVVADGRMARARASSSSGGRSHWDVVPQMQVTLSRRQHIMINVGVRIPVNERDGRAARRCSPTSCGTGSTAAAGRLAMTPTAIATSRRLAGRRARSGWLAVLVASAARRGTQAPRSRAAGGHASVDRSRRPTTAWPATTG